MSSNISWQNFWRLVPEGTTKIFSIFLSSSWSLQNCSVCFVLLVSRRTGKGDNCKRISVVQRFFYNYAVTSAIAKAFVFVFSRKISPKLQCMNSEVVVRNCSRSLNAFLFSESNLKSLFEVILWGAWRFWKNLKWSNSHLGAEKILYLFDSSVAEN